MTAYVFTITSLETGRRLGAAVLCPQARYASIAWHGAPRPSRPFVLPMGWLAIERELGEQLPAGPLPTTSPIFQAFELFPDHVLQYVSVEPIGEASAGWSVTGAGEGQLVAAAALDARLRAAAISGQQRLELA